MPAAVVIDPARSVLDVVPVAIDVKAPVLFTQSNCIVTGFKTNWGHWANAPRQPNKKSAASLVICISRLAIARMCKGSSPLSPSNPI